MLNNLTHKQRYYLLVAGLVLVSIFVIMNVFRRTYLEYTQHKSLKTQIERAHDAPSQLKTLQKQLQASESILHPTSEKELDSTEVHERILSIVSTYCTAHQTTMIAYPPFSTFAEGDFAIQTDIVTVQGDFKRLLDLLYLLERQEKPAKIASVKFRTTKNFETKGTELTMSLYLQTFKKASHE